MKWKASLAAISAAAGLVVALRASAQEPFDSKLQASTYNTKLVQAEDECTSPLTVIGGVSACAPANGATTAPGEQFSVGKLLVKGRTGPSQVLAILKSSSNSGEGGNSKQLAGKNLRVRLVLRVTKRSTAGFPSQPVTWTDVTLTCGIIQPPVPSSGNFLFKGQLTGLAGCNMPLVLAPDQNNKEILSAEIFDADTGLTVAVPGVRAKPPGS